MAPEIGLLRNHLHTYQRLINRIEASHGAWCFRQQIELKKYKQSLWELPFISPGEDILWCAARSAYHLLSLTLIEISSCGQMDRKEGSDHTEFKLYNFLLMVSLMVQPFQTLLYMTPYQKAFLTQIIRDKQS